MKKILHTYFFGYAAYKYRRLIRSSLIILFISILIYGICNIRYLPFGKGDVVEKIYKEYPLLVTPSKNYFTEKEARISFTDSLNIYIKQGRLKKVNISKNDFVDLLKEDEKDNNENNRITVINALLLSINKDNFFNVYKYVDSYGNETWHDISDYELRRKLGISPFFEENSDFKDSLLTIFFGLLLVGFISYIVEPFISEKTKNKMNENN
jgi:hypothetical protein